MNYCPACWPSDLGEQRDGHCLDCGGQILTATPVKQIELLTEQNEALALALGQAMEALGAGELSRARRPELRLVRSASRKNCKEPADD